MSMNEQILKVWKYLSENNVNYLTIGGFAVNIYVTEEIQEILIFL